MLFFYLQFKFKNNIINSRGNVHIIKPKDILYLLYFNLKKSGNSGEIVLEFSKLSTNDDTGD